MKVIFNYKGNETIIQCKINETMEEIINKYKLKIEIIMNIIYIMEKK